MRLNMYKLWIIMVWALTILSNSLFAKESKILLIVVDQLTIDWVGAYGSPLKTPAMDRLAENGLRFTTNWQVSNNHVHAEQAFLHGRYEGHDKTFVDHLKQANYRTYYLGEVQDKAYLNEPEKIINSGFEYFHLNSGSIKSFELKNNLENTILNIFQKPEASFVLLRLSSESLKTKADYKSYTEKIDELLNKLEVLDEGLEQSTIIFTSLTGTKLHNKINHNLTKGLQLSPSEKKKKQIPEKLILKDQDVKLPLIVKSHLIPKKGLYTRDLVDTSSFFKTILDLAEIDYKKDGFTKSFKPSICGDLDPFKKRNWIYCDMGKDKMLRSWDFVYYVSEKIYGLGFDPEQKVNLLSVKTNDKIYAGERLRLKMIYERDFLGIQPSSNDYQKIETIK